MSINRSDVLIARAVKAGSWFGVDYKRSTVEEHYNQEFVVLRGRSNLIAVFSVYEWQVEELEPEDWPDDLLAEQFWIQEGVETVNTSVVVELCDNPKEKLIP